MTPREAIFHTERAARASYLVTMNGNNNEAGLRREVEAAYRKDGNRLLARAKRLARNREDAEDALQDAFASALGSLDLLAAVGNLPGWLFTALRNRLSDLWRREAVRTHAGELRVSAETLAEIAEATGLNPEDQSVMDALAAALADAIGALPPDQREVIEAQALAGIGFRELSERTGVPVSTLMARKRYAIEKLARTLRDWAGS